jgi:DNA repair ATPase RecN
MSTSHSHLKINNFGPIESVDIYLSGLTVLVGPQGTGKSLALQWLKLAIETV